MKTRWILETVIAALIAAMYTALTVAVAPLSYGLVQCRLSEALTVLAAFTPAAVPGLTVGCFLSNLIGLSTGANIAGALDLLLGPLATGLAALLSYRLRRYRRGGVPWLSTLPPILLNALIVGTELAFTSPVFTWQVLLTQIALVGAGQLAACLIGGALLAKAITGTGLERLIFNERS